VVEAQGPRARGRAGHPWADIGGYPTDLWADPRRPGQRHRHVPGTLHRNAAGAGFREFEREGAIIIMPWTSVATRYSVIYVNRKEG